MQSEGQRQRQNIKRVDSREVQGDGSFVEVRIPKWGESKRIAAEAAAIGDDQAAQMALTERLITEHVVSWNWRADREGDLPVPKSDPSVIDELTNKEMEFLGKAINGNIDPKP